MIKQLGPYRLSAPVFLAPMSGITDLPFRRVARDSGAGIVVSEMVACDSLARQRADMVRRAEGGGEFSPFVMQLAGRETYWMAKGVELAEAAGADIIDINMGCPARQVTNGLSGSALMRDLDHALSLIRATVDAASVPVTLKMRLGWDETSLNAPELARRAEDAGIALVTVHGRTRCQFYKGKADWAAVARVREATSLPLVVNGDITSIDDAKTALARAGVDAVMIGRGAQGRPWLLGQIGDALSGRPVRSTPSLSEQGALVTRHYRDIVAHEGEALGVRTARKHLSWYLEELARGAGKGEDADACEVARDALALRREVVRLAAPREVLERLTHFYGTTTRSGTAVPDHQIGEAA